MKLVHSAAAITDWKQFGQEVRYKGHKLLGNVDAFPNSILVTGCQRSGTTMTARILMNSDGLINYAGIANYGRGVETSFDGAMLLCGLVENAEPGRYCFQTTHINEKYREYFEHQDGHKLVWVLRNPQSVVTSMLYNWPAWAMDELFRTCGIEDLSPSELRIYQLLSHPIVNNLQSASLSYNGRGGRLLRIDRLVDEQNFMFINYAGERRVRGLSKLERACHNYNAKVKQLKEVATTYPHEQLFVIDYDVLVQQKETVLPQLYEFVELDYKPEYADQIHSKSLKKKSKLNKQEQQKISQLCDASYQAAKKYLTPLAIEN